MFVFCLSFCVIFPSPISRKADTINISNMDLYAKLRALEVCLNKIPLPFPVFACCS
jgi:hypothetical protein